MIRILLPNHTYHAARIKLVERITSLQLRTHYKVKRAYIYLEFHSASFLEGFLENESKLDLICEMLSDNPLRIIQEDEAFSDVQTILIEDSDDIENHPYEDG